MKLAIDTLRVSFNGRTVVNIDSLELGAGEFLGLAGESGSGKSMTALSVVGLAQSLGACVTGSIRLDGQELVGLPERELRSIRGRRIAMIFQAPVAAFNPVFRVGEIFARTLKRHGHSRKQAQALSARATQEVMLSPAVLRRYPHQLSGGQAQRLAIALALALHADVLLADEPTSALDVTVQAEILDLLRRLRETEGMAVLFISHDLSVISTLCDRVAVMQAGRIVEGGPVGEVFDSPGHPYTRELLNSVPTLLRGAPGHA
jgi:peptide/nickel transport system ATP-binding protein